MSDVSMKQLMGQALKNVREENNSSSASITRLFFCGAFGDTTADSICSSLNQIKQQTEQHTASEQVTKITGGAMIVSNSAVVGFLECPSSVVATILSEIKSRNLLLNARILSTSEDCPCREFSTWGVYSANPPSEDVDISSEGATNIAVEIFSKIIAAAEQLTGNSNDSNDVIRLQKTVSLPSSSKLIACSKSNDFCSMDEYLSIFGSQVNVEIASESAWPLQKLVVFK